MKKPLLRAAASLSMLSLAMLMQAAEPASDESAAATSHTAAFFAASTSRLDWSDTADFANAERGLVAVPDQPGITSATGQLVWTFKDYQAMKQQAAPDTVHPALWRQAQLNAANGLFQVSGRIFQIRGFDLANMTIIESDTGIIVIDPLTSVESAGAALALYQQHRGVRPVRAVIYTHNHMDHFAGVAAVVSRDQVAAGDVRIFAPLGFEKEAISENLLAGNAMLRRTIWYSGIPLPRTQYGTVDAGLGPGVANGVRSYIAPTDIIEAEREGHVIDGFEIEFQLANNTEAPSELVMYYPGERVLNVSEVAVHTVHNLLTPRGAKVRDALQWAGLLDSLLRQYAPQADVMIAQHHWPTWGSAEIAQHLQGQRDFYKFAHDQAVQLANQGYNKEEISERIQLPEGLSAQWALQDYYGTLGSAGKAVFQFYLGWYDGNPAKLQQLPEGRSAARYVEYMGGSERMLALARRDYDEGEYQWVVQVLQHLVFAEPDNQAARDLSAAAFIQLGYQQTSATWRNLYLSAAHELRNGIMEIPVSASGNAFTDELTPENVLDYAGVSLDSQAVAGLDLQLVIEVTDPETAYTVQVGNGILNYHEGNGAAAPVVLKTDRVSLARLFSRQLDLQDAVDGGLVTVSGDRALLEQLLSAMVVFSPNFSLVAP